LLYPVEIGVVSDRGGGGLKVANCGQSVCAAMGKEGKEGRKGGKGGKRGGGGVLPLKGERKGNSIPPCGKEGGEGGRRKLETGKTERSCFQSGKENKKKACFP